VALLLNEMVRAGVVVNYAVFGAVAQMRYTESVATLDADILIALPEPNRLNLLSSIYQFCRQHGYQPEGEAVTVGAWPVQFIPTLDRLTEAALRDAETAEVDGVPLRVVTADYLAAIALSVGRAKNFARVCALLEAKATTPDAISRLCSEFGLTTAWDRFRTRFPDA